jgi:hypothetical protein
MLPRDEREWKYTGPFSTLPEVHAFQMGFGVGFSVATPWPTLSSLAGGAVAVATAFPARRREVVQEVPHSLSGVVLGVLAGVGVRRMVCQIRGDST